MDKRFIIPTLTAIPLDSRQLVKRRIARANEILERGRHDLHSFCTGLFTGGGNSSDEKLYTEMVSDLHVKGRIIFDPYPPKISIDNLTGDTYRQFAKNPIERRTQLLTFAHLGMELALHLMKIKGMHCPSFKIFDGAGFILDKCNFDDYY